MVAIVEREVDSQLGSSKEQAFTCGVFTDGADISAVGNTRSDLRPGFSGIARAIEMRSDVGQAMAVNGGVGSRRLEMGGLDHAELAPRRQARRRDITPGLATIARQVDQAGVSADPDESHL